MQPKYEISTNLHRIKLFILGAKLHIALTEPVILLSREIIGDSVGFTFLNPVPYCRGAILESPVEWELLGHVIDNNEASCSSELPRIPTTLFPSPRFCNNAAGLVRSGTDH